MTTYKTIKDFSQISFKSNFEMDNWFVNIKGLIVSNTRQMHKYNKFETLESLKKFVKTKYNYSKKYSLKKGCNGDVTIEQ